MPDTATYASAEEFRSDQLSLNDLCQRSDKLFARMENWLTLCQAIAEIFYPERADFNTKAVFGDEIYNHLFDGEPARLRQELANTLGVMLRRRGEDWFTVKAFPSSLNDDYSVKSWCADATATMREIIYAPSAMFTKAMNESDNDYVAFGTSIVSHTYNKAESGLFFKTLHPRDCAWAENEEGKIEEMHVKSLYSAWRLAATFGVDKLPQDMKTRLKEDPHTENIEVRRVVAPIGRYKVDDEGMAPRAAKYCAHYFIAGNAKKALGVGYFRTFPFLVRRWLTVTGEPFGRSMCTGLAMADARLLQQAQISIIESIEKAVNPPMFAPHDGIVGDLQIRASGVTYYDASLDYGSRRPIEVLPSGRADIGMAFTQERKQFLGAVFFQNILKLPGDREMTAYETEQRIEEIVRSASPIIEPMENENAELLDACFERALEKGAFDEPPPALDGGEVRYEFETPVSIAKRKLLAQKAQGVIAHIGNAAQIDPGAVDIVDWDAINRAAVSGIGDQKWVRDPAEVDAERKQRAEAAAAQQAEERKIALLVEQQKLAANAKNPVPGHGKDGERNLLQGALDGL